MNTRLGIRLAFISALLLLAVGTLSAKTDTLGFVGNIIKGDTTYKVNIFEKFTWTVHTRDKNGKVLTFVSARPDTLFNDKLYDTVYFSTTFYVDTPALGKIVVLNSVLEGSVRVSLNGENVMSTGIFENGSCSADQIAKKYATILFKDTTAKIEIVYWPYKTMYYDLNMSIYQKHAADEKIQNQIETDNKSYSSGCYYLAFAVVFLFLFVFFREQRENLYFSLFCFSAACFYLCDYLKTDLLYSVDSFFDIFAFEFLSIFFCKILANREKSKVPLLIIVCLFVLCCMPFVRYGEQIEFRTSASASWVLVATYAVLYSYTFISVFYFLVQGIGQKRWEARTILFFCFVPIVLFVLLSITAIFIFLAKMDKGQSASNLAFYSTHLADLLGYFKTAIVYIYPLAAVFILGKRNGLNQLKLIAQVKSIKTLSDENLAKEIEKQQILENQKEALEKEVALRTEEIVAQKDEIEKQHELLKIEKNKSDDLLCNILPQEVADELKANGNTTAKHYDNVSVIFTDFVNFTRAGERMTPQGLIDELHACFKAFDDIMGKYGIEKIKTIGDAYLAVAGLPTKDPNHAENIVKAAQEINAFMAARMAKMGVEHTFLIRIGIHSGSVVAGIVGVKKFAYDIWGDTVNTAARMEQHGEAGKINISQTTYELVKDKFSCEYRGEVEAKGKGVMKMYFVS